MFYTPIFHVIAVLEPLARVFLSVFDMMSRMLAIQTMVAAVQHHAEARISQSLPVAILIGTISACGGGFVGEALSLTQSEWRFQAPKGLDVPSPDALLALICSTIYVLLSAGNGENARAEAFAAAGFVMLFGILYRAMPADPPQEAKTEGTAVTTKAKKEN
eukprot:Colp12_sorted_trinity150504_noHs@27290